MTVENLVTKNTYLGNGATKTYPYTFLLPDNNTAFIRCYKTKVTDGTTVEVADFTVDTDACEVTYPASGEALTSEYKFTLARVIPLTQMLNLVNNGPFFAQDIETSLDKAIIIAQQISEITARALKLDISTNDSISANIPAPVPLHSLRWNADGTMLETTMDPATVLPAAEAAKTAAETAAGNAGASATAAAGSATAAGNSKTVAETAAGNADASATAAAGSATAAGNSKTEAETAASNAGAAATAAAGSATAAEAAKTAAETAASNAGAAATAAAGSATAAGNSKTEAETAASNAGASATAAAGSETAAEAAKTAAETAAGSIDMTNYYTKTEVDTIVPDLATQAEAETGVDNNKYSSPLRVMEAITHMNSRVWIYDRGDGSDETLSPTSDITISGVKNYTSVNIPSGVTVTVNPWALIKCQGDFVVAGILRSICRSGGVGGGYNAANYGSPGSAGRYCGYGGAGGNEVGGAGGAGGGSVNTDDFGLDLKSTMGLLFRTPLGMRGVGGSGGGGGKDSGYGGARGGYGGAGGGSIVIITSTLTVTGLIHSNGENGQSEQAWPGGGGGGGGGGEVLVITASCNDPTKITATGGTGGSSGAPGAAGSAGLVAIYYRDI